MAINKNVAGKEKQLKYLNSREAELLGFISEGSNIPAYVYLKYFDHQFECFSDWQADELKQFSQFINKLRQTSWQNIYKSAGRPGNKKGLGYTIHKNTEILPNENLVKILSPDVTFFELRVSGSMRVHGFRQKSVFFLIWLDRKHRIYLQ